MSAKETELDIAAVLQSSSKKGGKHRFCLLILLLCCAAGTFLYFRQQGLEGGGPKMAFKTERVTIDDLVVVVTATGTLEPTNEVDVGSELSGNIKAVLVDFNDQVTEGQVLARLDVSELEAQVKQTQAFFQAAKAKVAQAQATVNETAAKLRQLEKVRKLSSGKLPAQVEMDNAKAAATRASAAKASAEAGVAEVQARLDITLNELTKAEIISPINGIVLSRNIEKGQTVAASFSAPVLFKLAEDLTKMELHVAVDEADIGQVKERQEAVFTVDAYPERKFSAVIRQVRFASTATEGVVTYETVLMVDNTDLALRPGMTATAEIVVQKVEQALTVPNAALRFSPRSMKSGQKKKSSLLSAIMPQRPKRNRQPRPAKKKNGQQSVWVLLKDGQPRQVKVTTGFTDGSGIEILEGDLRPGELVITAALSGGKAR